jgi:hypothetical protein
VAEDLTIVALPKPFEREFDAIQWNAIQSWIRLEPRPRIILVGNERGTAEIATEVGALHIEDVARSESGTPLVSDVFARAEEAGRTPWLCYVNADIVLLSDFSAALARVRRRRDRFLLVGRRWDLLIEERLGFEPGWEDAVRNDAVTRGRLHAATGIDYFVFPRGMWGGVPPFCIGRFSWDNWLLWRALQLGVPLVDASSAVLAIHQDHPTGEADAGESRWREQERLANVALAGGRAAYYTLDDATHLLTAQGSVTPAWTRRHLHRRLQRLALKLDDRTPTVSTAIRWGLRQARTRFRRAGA